MKRSAEVAVCCRYESDIHLGGRGGADPFQLALLQQERFDLVIVTLHVQGTTPLRFAQAVRDTRLGTPVVLLAHDTPELNELLPHSATFDRVFVWSGNFRLLIAILKSLEDERNVAHDTSTFGVQCLLVVEDNVRDWSYFLPLLYSEVIQHSRQIISEGVNAAHRALRTRARPKILLRSTWEEAMQCLETYGRHISGVICDVRFPRGGEVDDRAGFAFADEVRRRFSDVPVLLQSTEDSREPGTLLLRKTSPTFEHDLGVHLREHFAFGDFVFRLSDGREVGRANDLPSLEEQLHRVPDESVRFHAEHNHFSNWLKARTEFDLASRLRPNKVEDFASVAAIRAYLILQLHEHRSSRQRGFLTEFSKGTFDPETSFARTPGGLIGGKARGLAFFNALLSADTKRFDGLDVEVPPALVIGTDVFEKFLHDNHLNSTMLSHLGDDEIQQRFLDAQHFSRKTKTALIDFLDLVRHPLAVRSSSQLEDAQFHPFAGVYQTFMLPNADPDPHVRLHELITAIKRVYASTFYRSAREYLKVTSLRFEDEKMAVIIQQMVGAQHGERFYPEIAGVARSYNFYPVGEQQPEEGIVSIALGLGKTVADGRASVHFCPKYPDHLQQFFSTRDARLHHQREFYALRMNAQHEITSTFDERVVTYDLGAAERDGTLNAIASTYSAENDALYDGVSRPGMRIVTFAPILRDRMIPLGDALAHLCTLASDGIGMPVEIEFAVNLAARKLAVLQVRPLPASREAYDLNIDDHPRERLLCSSPRVLGHGAIRGLRDVVVVDIDRFDRTRSHQAASQLAGINQRLAEERRPYVLIGPGRWGSLDPLLGIPVKWEQISGARVIVEAGFRDISVDPSQGSHFFQNLTAFQVGYFSVGDRVRESWLDTKWLAAQQSTGDSAFVRHIRLDGEIVAMMNGHTRRGVILKP